MNINLRCASGKSVQKFYKNIGKLCTVETWPDGDNIKIIYGIILDYGYWYADDGPVYKIFDIDSFRGDYITYPKFVKVL